VTSRAIANAFSGRGSVAMRACSPWASRSTRTSPAAPLAMMRRAEAAPMPEAAPVINARLAGLSARLSWGAPSSKLDTDHPLTCLANLASKLLLAPSRIPRSPTVVIRVRRSGGL
jgi:hypothetical protein